MADSTRHHIVVYDAPSLTYRRTLGRKGSARGQLRAPDGVAIHEGLVYVADTCNHRVCVFHIDGGEAAFKEPELRRSALPYGCERIIGRLGSDAGLFEFPRGVAIAHGAWLLVSESTRVQLLTLTGEPRQVLAVPGSVAMRGIATDGWNAYVADYEGHAIHQLKIDKFGATDGREQSSATSAAPTVLERLLGGDTNTRVVDEQLEGVRQRIRSFMQTHDVHFNGAGEDGLRSVAQTWSIDHSDESVRRSNAETIRGIASILKEHPSIACEVHGETGAARSAPDPLAAHFGLDPVGDCSIIMDKLARYRAQAVLDALIAEGVPRAQLELSYLGMGGGVKVDFIPRRATTGAADSTSGAASSGKATLTDTIRSDEPRSPSSQAASFLASLSLGSGGTTPPNPPPSALSQPPSVTGRASFGSLATVEADPAPHDKVASSTGAEFLAFSGTSRATSATPSGREVGLPSHTALVSDFLAPPSSGAASAKQHPPSISLAEGVYSPGAASAKPRPPSISVQPSTPSSDGVVFVGAVPTPSVGTAAARRENSTADRFVTFASGTR